MCILLTICYVFLLCIQGGYYPQTYIVVGSICGICCIVRAKKIRVSCELLTIALITMSYVVSCMVTGISYSSIGSALLPMVMLIISIIYGNMPKEKKCKLMAYISLIGIISSVIAVAMYIGILDIPGTVYGRRLLFTFQYANAAGAWFGISFLLGIFSDNKYIKMLSVFSFAALLMTGSVGATVIMVILLVIHAVRRGNVSNMNKKTKVAVLAGGGLGLVFAVVLVAWRYGEALYTFAERLVQSYDGVRTLATHILTGIGPGNWAYEFPLYQSAQYTAGVVHNYYVQSGVDAGIAALAGMILLFVLTIRQYKKHKGLPQLAALYIMLHSFMDYELAFASVYMLLIFGIMYEPSYHDNYSKGIFEIKPVIIRTVSACVFVLCIIGIVGVIKTRNLQNAADSGNLSKAMAIFEDNRILMENGYKECEIIGVQACKTGNYEYVPETKSARLKMYEVISKESRMDEIIELLNSQPYNRRVIANTREMLTQYRYSDEDKERYRECLGKINDSLDKWPANMLNNQVKYHITEE